MTDTIDVRPDERFDQVRLAQFLRGKLPGSDLPLTVRQFGGGAANLTYLLDLGGEHEYVLRRPPLGPVAKSAHDMSREHRVLSVLHQSFSLAPQSYLYCDDPTIIGADFFIMERRRGVVVRREIPPQFADDSNAPRRMSKALIDALADFHGVDYASIGLEGLGKPEGFVRRQVEGWYKRWNAAQHDEMSEEIAGMDALYAWLREREPSHQAQSLVHNDFKLDNTMLAADDPGRLVAVFDWDMCTLGDPLCDLGALLCYWTEPSDPADYRAASMMPQGDIGFLTRQELVERYAARSGRDVSNIRYYHVLGIYRLVVIAAQIYIRFLHGQTQDQRFTRFGPMIPRLIGAAQTIAAD